MAQSVATPTNSGVRVGALIRSSFDISGDDVFATPGGADLTGFRFQDAIIWVEGTVGDVDVRINLNGADPAAGMGGDNTAWPPTTGSSGLGSAIVQDAYGRWNLNESFRVYMGQFKCPVLMSSQVWQGNLLMIDRTRLGQMFDVWQPGAALTYDVDGFHLKLAVQNGADGVADEFGMVARGEYNINGGAKEFEGAYGSGGNTTATIGLAYFNDSSQIGGSDLGSAIALDFYADIQGLSIHGEIMDMDEELAGNMGLSGSGSDAMPYSLTASYMLPSEKFELAVRYQDMDDDLSTTMIGGGLNYYSHGHNAKWQFNASQFDN
ncbi:MAG TPA: hypothetical protein VMT18_14605, partial [Planctomycetota bacterium]|nr:hypothetical protein [Planctomycetota bacterium]